MLCGVVAPGRRYVLSHTPYWTPRYVVFQYCNLPLSVDLSNNARKRIILVAPQPKVRIGDRDLVAEIVIGVCRCRAGRANHFIEAAAGIVFKRYLAYGVTRLDGLLAHIDNGPRVLIASTRMV